jgi:endo-1,4-beta-D-glucanase Y
MDQTVASYFDAWKATYVKPSNGNTPGGGYYVAMKGTGGSGSEKTTSEAHGYGMILFALMAGHDPAARDIFDGFFNMYDKHRSTLDDDLMSWVIDETESTSKDQASATDGDMDIAYALLLADAQWGSAGTVDYRGEAVRIIQDGIKPSEMGASSHRTLLGDWSSDEWATRSSDWMTGHFHAYGTATGDAFWATAATTAYEMIGHMRTNHAPSTGLMPDFVVGTTPHPASPYFLEAETDGAYSWNACRFPLRMAVDYAHHGSPAAREAILSILAWLVPKTGNDPEEIVAGYSLGGQKLVSYTSTAFTGPLVAACVADTSRQEYLNQGFSLLAQDKSGYYEDTLALLSMLLVTGNWWSP